MDEGEVGREVEQNCLQTALLQEKTARTATLGVKGGLSSSRESQALRVMQKQALP